MNTSPARIYHSAVCTAESWQGVTTAYNHRLKTCVDFISRTNIYNIKYQDLLYMHMVLTNIDNIVIYGES